jgi:hypothetical protein
MKPGKAVEGMRDTHTQGNKADRGEQGIVLFVTMILLLLLTSLGMTSMNLATLELRAAGGTSEDRAAEQLADAAVDLVVSWFHQPGSLPPEIERVLIGQMLTNGDSPLIMPPARLAPGGSPETVEVLFDAATPDGNRTLNDPTTGWFRSLAQIGKILRLRVYGLTRTGLCCTVEVTAQGGAGGDTSKASVAVDLGRVVIPPLQAAAQVMESATASLDSEPVQPLVHWGDLRMKGDVRYRTLDEIPRKTITASVSNLPYDAMQRREDLWFDLYIGGALTLVHPSPLSVGLLPLNIYQQQDPVPGMRWDLWSYEHMKKLAKRFGTYYGTDRSGLLYRDGIVEPGKGLKTDEALSSRFLGDHRGLVFVDTVDQEPPSATNLSTITLQADYAEGVFVVCGHLNWKPKGTGFSIPALSPSPEGTSSTGLRTPVLLSQMHLQGVLYEFGTLTISGHPRAYGAVVAPRILRPTGSEMHELEVWYNADLARGFVRGVPLVVVVPGTRRSAI